MEIFKIKIFLLGMHSSMSSQLVEHSFEVTLLHFGANCSIVFHTKFECHIYVSSIDFCLIAATIEMEKKFFPFCNMRHAQAELNCHANHVHDVKTYEK
jgi:hypothetical protein